MSLATLGVLCALSAGGGVWSALTGPRVADVQLHDAASNTVSASSFVVTLDAKIKQTTSGSFGSPTTGSSAPLNEITSSSETIVYEAPDRVSVKDSVEVNGQKQPIGRRDPDRLIVLANGICVQASKNRVSRTQSRRSSRSCGCSRRHRRSPTAMAPTSWIALTV